MHSFIKMIRNHGPVRRCPTGSVREPAGSSRLCSPVGILNRDEREDDFSVGNLGSDGAAEKTSRTMVISSPEGAEEPDARPDQEDGTESEVVDVLGCASDDPPSAEVEESFIRSGVSGSEGSGVISSVMGEICEGLHALNSFCNAGVSCDT